MVAVLFVSGCYDANCDGGDPEVAMDRSLSQERLSALYADASPFATGEHWHGEMPEEFKDLKPIALRSHSPGELHLRLRGCMDHHIDVVVIYPESSRNSKDAGRIELWFDELPRTEEVLWRESA